MCDCIQHDFVTIEPTKKSEADSAYIGIAEAGPDLCVAVELYDNAAPVWSITHHPTRIFVLKAVLMARCARESHNKPVVLHSERSTALTIDHYQCLGHDSRLMGSMSAAGLAGDNAAAECLLGQLKRECMNRRRFQTACYASTVVSGYIERSQNPHIRQRMLEI